MKNISELFNGNNLKDKPWIIIGKGPSFSALKNINLKNFYSFALNHAISQLDEADICHLIDFDVFEKCQDEIDKKARFLCMPMNPHFKHEPSELTLKDLVKTNKVLDKINKEGRLFWYNHLQKNRLLNKNNSERIFYKNVDVKYFSAEAAFNILGMNGIKEIYSAGIDGGSEYDQKFSDSTLLANGRSSFDIQFDEIIKSIKHYDLTYSPIDAQYPVKIYVGSQEEQMLSVKILEYSVKKRTTVEVEVFPLHKAGIEYGVPKDPKNRQRTPFSFQRFLIPQLNKFEGRAIYVDSDMQVFKDIRQLWNLPMAANDLLTVEKADESQRDLQFSVMLLDCAKLKWSIADVVKMLDDGELDYSGLMKEMKLAKNIGVKIPQTWNCLEWYREGESGLVHYTDMPTQPWVSVDNPLCRIWMRDLINAIDEGFISIDYVRDHVEKGWVRPSLIYQIENRVYDSINLPKEAVDLDKDFIAPYKKMEKNKNNTNFDAKKKEIKIEDCNFVKSSNPANIHKHIVLITEISNKILRSKSYKYFLRFIPPVKSKLKNLNKALKSLSS